MSDEATTPRGRTLTHRRITELEQRTKALERRVLRVALIVGGTLGVLILHLWLHAHG
jgi:hypothetical protein